MAQTLPIPLLTTLRGTLHSAGSTPFEVAELLGMAAALVLAAALANGPWLALPLGATLTVPFILRRACRGLRRAEETELP